MGDEKREEGVRLHTYIGESSRSCFERGGEHMRDVENLSSGSHMLKHIIEKHEGIDPTVVEFRMSAVKFHQSAFERQIYESVKIQSMRKNHSLLNSKSEYNRCALPRLGLKMGESEYKEKKREEEEDLRREEELENKIKEMRKDRVKLRRRAPRNQPKRKKMRLEDGSVASCKQERRKEESEGGEKRRNEGEEEEKNRDGRPKEKRRRLLQTDITDFIRKQPTFSPYEAELTKNQQIYLPTEADHHLKARETNAPECGRKILSDENTIEAECGNMKVNMTKISSECDRETLSTGMMINTDAELSELSECDRSELTMDKMIETEYDISEKKYNSEISECDSGILSGQRKIDEYGKIEHNISKCDRKEMTCSKYGLLEKNNS